ncbi:DUF1624 domain-containing protein [Azohydromonas sp. G-1-1-14]|uniref:DUF1624 domain-containing protein n=2 Tax=Azohydromonas caseinilytica TaxID=2728836 RepID=A0A848F535_9BURK|nr:heparan-alpha-glucosaminide N-acetyltransferase [Azohydromonas caseinilytica]NML14512.1 DUF1624 domain-containing protein [Azohydromonas caseinilytica]
MPLSHRFDRLDALRGFAMVWMAVFHFCFDLNNYRLLEPRQNFYLDPFWTLQRTAIVSLFLFCAGLSQALAQEAGQGGRRFWRRWAQIAGCALLVSAGSWFMFPRSWISFGVLHGMALMLILARALAPLRRGLWPLALAALLLPRFVQSPLFDNRWLNWTGLVTRKPVTEDYVPVLPWLGVLLLGLAAGQWLLAHRREMLGGPLPRAFAPLALLGRWPLSFYMLHQPILIGLILLAMQLR